MQLPAGLVEKYRKHLCSFEGKRVWHSVEVLEPYVSDPYRKYYFKWVIGEIEKHTGASLDDIHETMKEKFASERDKFGITHKVSVFSNDSKMKLSDKKLFIKRVRDWADDFLGVRTQEFEPRAHVE